MISLAAQHRWKIYQLDVKSTFLNGFLEEEIYVEQPLGYIEAENENKVYKLKKALYGSKQALRAWNTKIDRYFQDNEIEKCPYKHAIYVKKEAYDNILFACLYVDDLIFTGNNPIMFEDFKKSMVQEFDDRHWSNGIFSWLRSNAKGGRDFCISNQLCQRYS